MNEENARPLIDGKPVFRVPEYNLEALHARIAKMNKRAAKLGMEPISVTEVGQDFNVIAEASKGKRTEIRPKPGQTVAEMQDAHRAQVATFWGQPVADTITFTLRRFSLITATGTLPRVNGWAMAATIQHEEGGNILRTVPGFEQNLPVTYRTAGTACEHCSTNRRRNDTYVLQSETGWKQVGRNCLADFLRTGDATAFAQSAELLASLHDELAGLECDYDDEGGCTSRGERYFGIVDYLARVAAIIRLEGFCSRTEAKNSFGKTSTADFALCFYDSKFVQKNPETAAKFEPTAGDRERAEAAIAWAAELPADVTNDYLWNLRVISAKEQITYREAGLTASLVSAHARHLEKELKRKYERETLLNEHFGTVGKREEFSLTVMESREIEGSYGLTTIYKFRTSDGRTGVWFASGEGHLQLGHLYTLKASVKAHGEYQERKQTTLSRVSVIADMTALDDCAKGLHEYHEVRFGTECCTTCGEVTGEVLHVYEGNVIVLPN